MGNRIYTAKEVQGTLSKADFILAEQLYCSITALNTGTPVLCIAYMPKVNRVLGPARQKDKIINMDDSLNGQFYKNFAKKNYNKDTTRKNSLNETQ